LGEFRASWPVLRRVAVQSWRLSHHLTQLASGSLATAVVPFPRGFAFSRDGRLILASGTGPNEVGDNALVAFDPSEPKRPIWLVSDPELSPLDLSIARNGNIVVSSEHPMPSRLFANTIPRTAIWYAFFPPIGRPNFANRVACGLVLTTNSIASHRTRLSLSIL
jgi:hypothetical protein